jgi:hypothetical protein
LFISDAAATDFLSGISLKGEIRKVLQFYIVSNLSKEREREKEVLEGDALFSYNFIV